MIYGPPAATTNRINARLSQPPPHLLPADPPPNVIDKPADDRILIESGKQLLRLKPTGIAYFYATDGLVQLIRALVSKVIHSTPSRFLDPARFSFAHGGKGSRPFAVPTSVYDETIKTLRTSVDQAKPGETDRQKTIQKLTRITQDAEEQFIPDDDSDASFQRLLQHERNNSWRYGGWSINGPEQPPDKQ